MYRCVSGPGYAGCGGEFAHFKIPGKCPLCGVWASVQCTACSYTASAKVFVDNADKCPRCGARVCVPGSGAKPQTCKGCGKSLAPSDVSCPQCGYTPRSVLIILGSVGLVFLSGAIFGFIYIQDPLGRNFVGFGAVILAGFLFVCVSMGVGVNLGLFPHSPPKEKTHPKKAPEHMCDLCSTVWIETVGKMRWECPKCGRTKPNVIRILGLIGLFALIVPAVALIFCLIATDKKARIGPMVVLLFGLVVPGLSFFEFCRLLLKNRNREREWRIKNTQALGLGSSPPRGGAGAIAAREALRCPSCGDPLTSREVAESRCYNCGKSVAPQ